MKGLMEKLERIFLAITFAEAGESETAKQIMRKDTESEMPVVKSQKGIRIPATATE